MSLLGQAALCIHIKLHDNHYLPPKHVIVGLCVVVVRVWDLGLCFRLFVDIYSGMIRKLLG